MRRAIALAMLAWSAPVLAVGVGGLGLTAVAAGVVGLCLAAFVASLGSLALSRRIAGGVARPLAIALVVATTLATLRIATVSVFMADVDRMRYSTEPEDEFRRVHSCLSAYAEASRFTAEGGHNIYDRELYLPGGKPREIGPLRVDPFHYPPPFLLVMRAIHAVALDFWDLRRVWFAFQALALAAAIVGLAAWIGGTTGAYALLAGLLILASPHVGTTLQFGNFQITAIPLAAVAFALLMAGRHAVGGTLLAYVALAKIFPGILVVPLVAARQWRRLAWIGAAVILLLAVTLAVVGAHPFADFVSTALPDISSAGAFPQTEIPMQARVNWTVYGETVRLRLIGVESLTKTRGLMIAQVYGLGVVALAAWVGWKRRFDLSLREHRLALVQVALALVSLASFRSPFAGAMYGPIATLWVIGLAGAGASSTARRNTWFTGLVALASITSMIPPPATPAGAIWLWITGVVMLACIVVNVYVVTSSPRAVRVGVAALT